MPRFTIAIPTYNRAGYLQRSLQAALDQTAADVAILVCDNASTDDTTQVAQSFGDRVRYHRNPTNLGATANFMKAFELAETEYFSWLQDDDLIHRDFARRATEALDSGPDVAAYACFSVRTPAPDTFFHAFLTGPAIPLKWMQGGLTIIDGLLVAPVSLFYSFGNPPALAYRTTALRQAIATMRHRCVLYDERILLAATVVDGKVAVDPWPGAIFTDHFEQDYKRIFRTEPDAQTKQWFILADAVGDLLQGRGDSWRQPVQDLFRQTDLAHRLQWLRTYCPDPNAWRRANPIAAEVWALMLATLPEEERPAFTQPLAPPGASVRDRAKSLAKDLTPPVVWKALRRARRTAP